MKLKNKLISSIVSYRKNFDIIEIWHKKEIVIRDLHPDLLGYENKEFFAYYQALKNSATASMNNGTLSVSNSDYSVSPNLSDSEWQALEGFDYKEKIELISLHRLAGQVLNTEVTLMLFNSISKDDSAVTLSRGIKIPLCPIKEDQPFSNRLIQVLPDTGTPSFVGPYKLYPGDITYGIFQEDRLVMACPPYASNNRYLLRFEKSNNKVLLNVYDAMTNLLQISYKNAHFFMLSDDGKCIVIDGFGVLCVSDEALNNRLRREVKMYRKPQFVELISDTMVIHHKDSSIQTITL